MPPNILNRDENLVPVIGLVDDATGEVRPALADSATGRLKVSATGIVPGGGTVTSVAMTVPTGLTVSGSPITGAGTLTVALDTGYVIPLQSTLDAKLTNITGLVTAGTNVTVDGTGTSGDPYVINASGGGSGTVTSVAASVPTGLTISGSPVTTSGTLAFGLDTGYVIPTQATLDAKITNPMTTGGDLIYGGASGTPTRLANGSAGQVLTSNGTTLAPTWETVTGTGTVTSVAASVPTGLTVSGSPITTSGTLAIALDTGYVIPLQSTLDAKITNPMTTGGDIIYGGASGTPTRLANGTAGYVLTSQGTTLAPVWAAVTATAGGSSGQLQYNNAGSLGGVLASYSGGNTIAFGAENATFTLSAVTAISANTKGGAINVLGGNGLGSGAGGDVQVQAGEGGVTNASGGSVLIVGGTYGSGGSGLGGDVFLSGGYANTKANAGNVKIYAYDADDYVTVDARSVTAARTLTVPDSSGTIALQSAASGTFTTADAKTVTVVNGIITSIV